MVSLNVINLHIIELSFDNIICLRNNIKYILKSDIKQYYINIILSDMKFVVDKWRQVKSNVVIRTDPNDDNTP